MVSRTKEQVEATIASLAESARGLFSRFPEMVGLVDELENQRRELMDPDTVLEPDELNEMAETARELRLCIDRLLGRSATSDTPSYHASEYAASPSAHLRLLDDATMHEKHAAMAAQDMPMELVIKEMMLGKK